MSAGDWKFPGMVQENIEREARSLGLSRDDINQSLEAALEAVYEGATLVQAEAVAISYPYDRRGAGEGKVSVSGDTFGQWFASQDTRFQHGNDKDSLRDAWEAAVVAAFSAFRGVLREECPALPADFVSAVQEKARTRVMG